MSAILPLCKWWQNFEFEANLCYIVSSRPVWAIEKDPISNNNNKIISKQNRSSKFIDSPCKDIYNGYLSYSNHHSGFVEIWSIFVPLFFRFSQLKGLNLSHNKLGLFPVLLCEISTLTELNLSCNGFHDLPSQIGNLLK